MKNREIRIELIIATLALCASAAASIATVVQTRVVGNQLSASVWPYLSFDTTVSLGHLQLSIDNDGLGPALIRDARLSIDGKPTATWTAAFKLFARTEPLRAALSRSRPLAIQEHDIRIGSVIRPGVSSNIIDVRNAAITVESGTALQQRIDMSICYCSLLGQCWTTVLDAQDEPPHEVGNCPAKGRPLIY